MDVTTTHEWLTVKLPEMSPERLAFYTSRKHPIRKLQDRYCYVHAQVDGFPVIPSDYHLTLETAIKNNIKLFYREYTPAIPPDEWDKLAAREASVQLSILRSCSPLCCILDRLSQINYFLSYAYSRSLDYFNESLAKPDNELCLMKDVVSCQSQ